MRYQHEKQISISKHIQKVTETDKRCCCGKLLAKHAGDGVLIKCGRCKREVLIKFNEMEYDAAGSLRP